MSPARRFLPLLLLGCLPTLSQCWLTASVRPVVPRARLLRRSGAPQGDQQQQQQQQGDRLQKVMAHAGVASRRSAEEMILDGRVTVNDRLVTDLGRRVNLNTVHGVLVCP